MPPVGIFKCKSENHEIRSLTPDREPPKQHEWDTHTRVSVKVLTELGHTRNAIKKQTGVPERSQRTILKRPDRRPGRERVGAPHKLSKRDVRMMIRHLSKSRENRKTTWKQLASDHGPECHPDTVKRALNNEGYHKCNACHMIGNERHDCDREGKA